jgi:hypothetical protein
VLWGGPFTTALPKVPQSAYGMRCLAAAPPTRIEGRWGREDPTHDEASSTQPVQSPQGKRRPTASRVRQEPAEHGHGASVREGHMQREASPLVDIIRMYTI